MVKELSLLKDDSVYLLSRYTTIWKSYTIQLLDMSSRFAAPYWMVGEKHILFCCDIHKVNIVPGEYDMVEIFPKYQIWIYVEIICSQTVMYSRIVYSKLIPFKLPVSFQKPYRLSDFSRKLMCESVVGFKCEEFCLKTHIIVRNMLQVIILGLLAEFPCSDNPIDRLNIFLREGG